MHEHIEGGPAPQRRLLNETLVTLNEVPALLPLRRGRAVHMATLYRWVHRGVRGRKLETVRVGGTLATSREAIARFLQADKAPPTAAPPPNPAVARAEQQLDAFGI